MNKIQQHYMTLITAASPLPQVIRKPELMKLWLLKLTGGRLFLIVGLVFLAFAVSPLSQAMVDYLYPLDQDSFGNTLANLFNSPSLRDLEELRARRLTQIQTFFWGAGLIAAATILILDLPRSVEQAEQKALKLMQQSQEVSSSNPSLSQTLATTADNLRLLPSSPKDYQQPVDASIDTGKTRVVKKSGKKGSICWHQSTLSNRESAGEWRCRSRLPGAGYGIRSTGCVERITGGPGHG